MLFHRLHVLHQVGLKIQGGSPKSYKIAPLKNICQWYM